MVMRKNRRSWHFIISKRAGRYTFWYYGKRRWATRPFGGRYYYYNKITKSFRSPAPRNSGGLKGLKKWWANYRFKKYGLR